jgi:hypothetical protein
MEPSTSAQPVSSGEDASVLIRSQPRRYAVAWLLSQVPSVAVLASLLRGRTEQSGDSFNALLSIPPLVLVSVGAWGLLASFFLRVWKELEDDAIRTVAAKVRAAPGYAKDLAARCIDACQGWLAAWSPGFERLYRKRVQDVFGLFNDRGLGLINANRLDLEKVYVHLSVHPDVNFGAPPLDLLRRPFRGRESIWRFLRGLEPRFALVLLGAPGTGKTTVLQHLLLTFARGLQGNFRLRRRLPIFIEFRSISEALASDPDLPLAEIIRRVMTSSTLGLTQPVPNGWIESRLRRGHLALLFDGLDEVQDQVTRVTIATWIDRQIVSDIGQGNLFVCSSRPGGYRDAALKRARVVQVEPFSKEQSRSFVESWYRQNEIVSSGQVDNEAVRRRAQASADDLRSRLQGNSDLYDLSVNPLLLTMLCMVHRYHGALPGSRAQLYAEKCQVLLERWRQTRGIGDDLNLKGEQKLGILRPLASAFMHAGKRELRDEDIEGEISKRLSEIGYDGTPRAFLLGIQSSSGLMIEKELGVWSWAHKSFQEYLCADHWAQGARESPRWQDIIREEWWRETILLYSAKADASKPLDAAIESATPAALSLAWRLLLEAVRLAPESRRRAEAALRQALASRGPDFKTSAEAYLDLRMREWNSGASDSVRVRATPVSQAEYQLFINSPHWWDRRDLRTPVGWHGDWFAGRPEDPVRGLLPWQAARFVEWVKAKYPRLGEIGLPRTLAEISSEPRDMTVAGEGLSFLSPRGHGDQLLSHPSVVLDLAWALWDRGETLSAVAFLIVAKAYSEDADDVEAAPMEHKVYVDTWREKHRQNWVDSAFRQLTKLVQSKGMQIPRLSDEAISAIADVCESEKYVLTHWMDTGAVDYANLLGQMSTRCETALKAIRGEDRDFVERAVGVVRQLAERERGAVVGIEETVIVQRLEE